ncbi:MAG: hypothetical protein K940chlam9_01185 [Chlamydiae bacterium]|nr:hypothetical protein [Chlamydiota bacterium]
MTIREENSVGALEAMSRFAIDPRWLIYLPPTMSPTETCKEGEWLEHPTEAIAYYQKKGIKKLICEEKHMGSRAIVVVCRDHETAQKRFRIHGDEIGSCYTRTGRPFFSQAGTEQIFLEYLQEAITQSHLWETLQTNWICFDGELMPWSAKAQTLLKQQYASVGAAAEAALLEVNHLLSQAQSRSIAGLEELCDRAVEQQEMVASYRNAYRNYSWPVKTIEDYKFAPFHVLAHENSLNMDRDHLWHLHLIDQLCMNHSPLLQKTAHQLVEPENEESCQQAIEWWLALTKRGGEGMVVKPLDFTLKTEKGLVQPGLKCRGKEYLRLIYGLEYSVENNLNRLRKRGLKEKRSLALREYALGYEALRLFVSREPLYKVHEAVFGVLALECEPIDPRL